MSLIKFEAHPLRNQRGEVYHTLPAEECRVEVVSRRRIGRGADDKAGTEAAIVRSNGAWLPALF